MWMVTEVKRFLKWSALTALVISLTSCGLPAALGRTAGGLMQSAGSLVGPAMALGAL
jgi:hypothetical protein